MSRLGSEIISALYWPFIITSFFLYIIFYDRLQVFSKFILNTAPTFILLLGAVILFDKNRREAKIRKVRKEFESYLTITQYDIFFILFLMWFNILMIIFIMPLLFTKHINTTDVIQGIAAFTVFFWIRRRYFKFHIVKTGSQTYELDNTILITFFDAMKLDLLAFLIAIFIVAVPGLVTFNLNLEDIFQAALPLLSIFWINEKYFKFV